MNLTRSMIHIGPRARKRFQRGPVAVVVFFLLAILALAVWAFLVLRAENDRGGLPLAGIAIGTVVYLLAGYFVHPRPDRRKVGWFDSPFTMDDNFHRGLGFCQMLLWPGRFVTESFVDVVKLALRGPPPADDGANGGGAGE